MPPYKIVYIHHPCVVLGMLTYQATVHKLASTGLARKLCLHPDQLASEPWCVLLDLLFCYSYGNVAERRLVTEDGVAIAQP